ncbi:hypothetical protein K1T71_001985 [Dendrolimus kikuchii]|uniref:Uncharacterized protein n=1 Tax=Dendrolimus kikuchii TaxID=765133 RepID=A0ACC1DFK9_9NEOP|nr:hypothetical protein K1T71_001985 [Dendrolimus kikuchii]
MDLFVLNRYRDTSEVVDLMTQESVHLEKLKQKIEERKKLHATNKESDIIIIKQPQPKEDQRDTELSLQDIKIVEDEENNNEDRELTTRDKPLKEKSLSEFKVLGTNEFKKKIKVSRVLPYWLSHPLNVSTDLQNLSKPIEEEDWLHNTLRTTLKNEGLSSLFPVQKQVIPFILKEYKVSHVLRPRDICVSAPTGSGKTLAFVLPIIQILMGEVGCFIRGLVVLPVQELATQVAKVFKRYCFKTRLRVALLSGSVPLQQEQQKIVKYTESSGWVSDVDIIVCTAGRLVEHLQNTEGFSLKHLKFLVIDEADRIMDHIQNDWLYHVDKHIKVENCLMTGGLPTLNWNNITQQQSYIHKMLFSATLSQDPEKLERWGLFQPMLFSAAKLNDSEDEEQIRKYSTPAELKENCVVCNPENKPLVLYHFLVKEKWDKVLCFTNAAESAHRLAVLLSVWGKNKFKVAELSAALDRIKREAVLKKFTKSEVNVLIGTDALARGIDVPDCNYVVSYDPPRNIKTYIHRVGRTGRAGRLGQAVTVLLPNQSSVFKGLLSSGGKSELPKIEIPPNVFEHLSETYQCAIVETKKIIHNEMQTKVQKSIEIKRRFKPKKRKLDS